MDTSSAMQDWLNRVGLTLQFLSLWFVTPQIFGEERMQRAGESIARRIDVLKDKEGADSSSDSSSDSSLESHRSHLYRPRGSPARGRALRSRSCPRRARGAHGCFGVERCWCVRTRDDPVVAFQFRNGFRCHHGRRPPPRRTPFACCRRDADGSCPARHRRHRLHHRLRVAHCPHAARELDWHRAGCTPRLARRDEVQADALAGPVGHHGARELGSVVAAQHGRVAPYGGKAVQFVDQDFAGDGAVDQDCDHGPTLRRTWSYDGVSAARSRSPRSAV
jgi:hypothetical protein